SSDGSPEEANNVSVQGIGDLSVGATIHALRSVKGASTIPADQQVLGGAVENYRSNLLLSMLGSNQHSYVTDGGPKPPGFGSAITEQQMIMKELSVGSADAEADIQALAGKLPCAIICKCLTAFRVSPTDYVLHNDSFGLRAFT